MEIAYFLLSILIGFIASLLGLGGGFLIVPSFTFIGLSIHHAIGTSSAIIVFSSISAIMGHLKHGCIDYGKGLKIAMPSIVGAYIGAWVTAFMKAGFLKIIFGIALIFVAIKMIRHNMELREKNGRWLIPGGFLSGVVSGLLGVGGGVINVPLLAYAGLSIHSAVATSSFSIFFTSMASSAKHYMLGNIDLLWLAIFAPGIIIGSHIGARFVKRVKDMHLKYAFAIFMFLLAISMIWKGISH